MPNPLQAFCDANDGRIDEIVQVFGTYQPQDVSRPKILRWLNQFDTAHYDLALRLLESVEFYDFSRIHHLLRKLHPEVVAQFKRDGFSWNNVYFVPLGEPGESSHEMVRRYRDVNRLSPDRLKLVPDLQSLIYEAAQKRVRLAFVFVEDFIGSGKQMTKYWNGLKQIVSISPQPAMYVACCAACDHGIQELRNTPFQVLAVHYVPDRLYLTHTRKFIEGEKQIIRQYCNQAGNKPADVYLELMLAFAHGAPNNTVSVLRGTKGQRPWRGILPRYSDL